MTSDRTPLQRRPGGNSVLSAITPRPRRLTGPAVLLASERPLPPSLTEIVRGEVASMSRDPAVLDQYFDKTAATTAARLRSRGLLLRSVRRRHDPDSPDPKSPMP